MVDNLELRAGSRARLAHFIGRQLDGLFPEASAQADAADIDALLDCGLARLRPVLGAVRIFNPLLFDHFNALQHASLLYLLSTEAAAKGWMTLADRLFWPNKAPSGASATTAPCSAAISFCSLVPASRAAAGSGTIA